MIWWSDSIIWFNMNNLIWRFDNSIISNDTYIKFFFHWIFTNSTFYKFRQRKKNLQILHIVRLFSSYKWPVFIVIQGLIRKLGADRRIRSTMISGLAGREPVRFNGGAYLSVFIVANSEGFRRGWAHRPGAARFDCSRLNACTPGTN